MNRITVTIRRPGQLRPSEVRVWHVDEENLQDVQAEMAVYIADDLHQAATRKNIANDKSLEGI